MLGASPCQGLRLRAPRELCRALVQFSEQKSDLALGFCGSAGFSSLAFWILGFIV